MKNPIFVALDLDDAGRALEIAQELKTTVGGFKLGPRLIMREGAQLVSQISQLAPVFVDMKHFDIPSTMTSALRASFEAGASFATIHALSGREALVECAKLETQLSQQRPFQILSVTILTSWSETSYPPSLKSMRPADHVKDLAKFSLECGLKGVVCSGHELELLSRDHFKVVPGIRLPENESGDQMRVLGPKEAMKKGAQALVVGRPILEASDMKSAAKKFVQFSLLAD